MGLLDREAILERQRERQLAVTDSVLCYLRYTVTTASIPFTNATVFTINVDDINDEVPHFFQLSQPHVVEVSELRGPGSIIFLQPVDNDRGENATVSMSIISGNTTLFEITHDSRPPPRYDLVTLLQLDFERDPHMYDVVIRLTDGGNPSNSFDQEITVVLLNERDSPPNIAEDMLEFSLPEDHPVGPSHPFASINVTNADDVQGTIEYSILDQFMDPPSLEKFAVNASNGDLYLSGPLDLESAGNPTSYTFYVEVRNSPGFRGSDSVRVTVMVEDLNDNAPFLTCEGGTLSCPTPRGIPFTGQQYILSDFSSNETAILVLEGMDNDRSAVNMAVEISTNTPLPPGITLNDIPAIPNLRILTIDPVQLNNTCLSMLTITVRNTAPPMLSSTATVNIIKCGA